MYTVYFHSLGTLQIFGIYRFGGFLTALSPLPNMAFCHDMSFTRIHLCSKYFHWARGEGTWTYKMFPIS